jgi:hypothetical protein
MSVLLELWIEASRSEGGLVAGPLFWWTVLVLACFLEGNGVKH